MSIEELTAIVKPPKKPVQVGSDFQWARICAKLGVVFPDDYRDFCRTYGSGAFLDGEIYVFNAFDPEFADVFESQQDRVQAFHEVYDLPYPAFPQLPGAIKLGGDGLGNDLLYLARPGVKPWWILTPGVRAGRHPRPSRDAADGISRQDLQQENELSQPSGTKAEATSRKVAT